MKKTWVNESGKKKLMTVSDLVKRQNDFSTKEFRNFLQPKLNAKSLKIDRNSLKKQIKESVEFLS